MLEKHRIVPPLSNTSRARDRALAAAFARVDPHAMAWGRKGYETPARRVLVASGLFDSAVDVYESCPPTMRTVYAR